MRQFLLSSLEHVYALRKIFNIEMGQGHMLNFDELLLKIQRQEQVLGILDAAFALTKQ